MWALYDSKRGVEDDCSMRFSSDSDVFDQYERDKGYYIDRDEVTLQEIAIYYFGKDGKAEKV